MDVGASSTSGTVATYNASLSACEARPVANLDLDVQVWWRGNGALRVCATVDNNQAILFAGRLRLFVVELVSSQGWRDRSGNLYTNPLLDLALDSAFSTGPGQSTSFCREWSGPAVGFSGLSPDNIMVIGAVYSNTPSTAYSDPPTGNPFNAYPVQASTEAIPLPLGLSTNVITQAGGAVDLHLCGRSGLAGRPYLVLASLSGSSPGFTLPGGLARLPLNYDPFMGVLLSLANTPICVGFLGNLDNQGHAKATFNIPPLPSATGTRMHLAYLLHDRFDFASNPVDLTWY